MTAQAVGQAAAAGAAGPEAPVAQEVPAALARRPGAGDGDDCAGGETGGGIVVVVAQVVLVVPEAAAVAAAPVAAGATTSAVPWQEIVPATSLRTVQCSSTRITPNEAASVPRESQTIQVAN